MARVRKGKVFGLFQEKYKIDVYYKPVAPEVYHYLILDGFCMLRVRLYDNIVMAIDLVRQINDIYNPKFYDELTEFLMNQTTFTIMVSPYTGTDLLQKSCSKLDVPLVFDERFINMPKVAFDMINSYMKVEPGMYLLAITEEFQNVKVTEEPIQKEEITPMENPTVEVVEQPKKSYDIPDVFDLENNKFYMETNGETGVSTLFWNEIKMAIDMMGGHIVVKHMEIPEYMSHVVLKDLFNDFKTQFDTIYISIQANKDFTNLCRLMKEDIIMGDPNKNYHNIVLGKAI